MTNDKRFEVKFVKDWISVTFEHEYSPYGEQANVDAITIFKLGMGNELCFGLNAIQAWNPNAIVELIEKLRKLDRVGFSQDQLELFSYLIAKLEELSAQTIVISFGLGFDPRNN